MSGAEPLEIPAWVPRPIASLAQALYSEAIMRPAEFSGAHAEALRRVATDERMHEVWTEIYRRQGGVGRAGGYVHPAYPEMVRAHPHYSGVEHISQQPEVHDRVQDQAAALLFLVATGHSLWDRRQEFGPRTRTQAAADQEAETLKKLAAGHDADASTYDEMGDWRAARTLRTLAATTRGQAEMRRPNPRNPWIVRRNSKRMGNAWDRGLLISITQCCIILFGKKLLGTVATLSNVVLGRQDISKGTVQGVVKHVR